MQPPPHQELPAKSILFDIVKKKSRKLPEVKRNFRLDQSQTNNANQVWVGLKGALQRNM